MISGNTTGLSFPSSNTASFKVASLKNVTITGSTQDGLNLPSSSVFVNVTGSTISGNGGNAVNAAAPGTTVNIDRSTIANNAVALNAGASTATIRISGNNGGVTVPNATLAKN